MKKYHFVTEWFFEYPIEVLWDSVVQVQFWPSLWREYKKAVIRGPEPMPQIGSLIDCEVRGGLPYTLRFTIEITKLQPPNICEYKSCGDLMGTGRSVLTSEDSGTRVIIYWDVGMRSRILNLLGSLPGMRGLLERNHDKVMTGGYRALKTKLDSLAQM